MTPEESEKTYVYTVSGAGDSRFDGNYYATGESKNDYPVYTNGFSKLYYTGSWWGLEYDEGMTDYICVNEDPTGTWSVDLGISDAPTVTAYQGGGSSDEGDDSGSGSTGDDGTPPLKIKVSGLVDDSEKWSYANGIYESTDGGKNYQIMDPVEDGITYCCHIDTGSAWDAEGNLHKGFIFYLNISDPGNHSAIGTDICNLGTWRNLMYEVWENQPVIEEYDEDGNSNEGASIDQAVRVSGCPNLDYNGDYRLTDLKTSSGGPVYKIDGMNCYIYHLCNPNVAGDVYWFIGEDYNAWPGSYIAMHVNDPTGAPYNTGWMTTDGNRVDGMSTALIS